MSKRLLICDQDGPARAAVSAPLAAQGYAVVATGSCDEARAELLSGEFAAVLVDLQVPGATALGFLREVKRLQPRVDLLVMTTYESVETAVAAMQEGATDYLTKPIAVAELEARLTRLRALREQREDLNRLRAILDESGAKSGIFVDSPAMRAVGERIHLFADGVLPVLIAGEVGTGKELAARTIHALGRRRAQPFVVVPCGEGPDVLAVLQAVDGGTVLLDDVDALCLERQDDLVRFLGAGLLDEQGAERPIDVRILATTEIDLGAAVETERFRPRLRELLQRHELHLPSLRQRGDDVLFVARQFLRVLAAKEGREPPSLSAAAADLLRRHEWPGNIGELQRVIASAFTFSRSPEIEPTDLPEYLAREREPERPFTLHLEGQPHVCLLDLVRQFEQELVEWALDKAQGHESRAAEILGVPPATVESRRGRHD